MESYFKKLQIFIFLAFLFPASLFAATSSTSKDFKAPWWCRGGHAQTIMGNMLRKNIAIPYERERFELDDGDFLDLDWLETEKKAPYILIVHGLASSSESAYIKMFVDEISKKSWNAVVLNARGQTGQNRLVKTNHGGNIEDLDRVIKHVLEIKKPEKLYLVGFSLGGNILMKWLGDNAGFIPSEVQKAAVVSAPLDLTRTVYNLDHDWFNREVYVRSMLKVLIPFALEKEKKFPRVLNVEKVKRAKTFQVYDREVTARLNGFKDEKEYWKKSSACYSLPYVTLPTLIIHADTDPFFPGADLPYQEMLQSKSLQLIKTEDGGHLGFVMGKSPWQLDRWLEKTILDYFEK